MSFWSMANELRGALPKLPFAYARTLINRAWKELREQNLWSFQLYEESLITPPIINSGTCTFVQGSANIQFDLVQAVPAINAAQIAQPYSLITERQIRTGVGGIYNLISYNQTTGAAILDRPWGDPAGTLSYTIYQVYYCPAFLDHRTYLSVRNPVMFLYLNLTMTRRQLDAIDPQRLWYAWPTDVVAWGIDQRGAGTSTPSATLNFKMYELWGQPVNPFTYQCYGIRNGTDLVNPTDTLPYAVGEDTVLARAKYYAYEWAEANKDQEPRSSTADFKFLMGKSENDYLKFRTRDRRNDREFVDNWFIIRGVQAPIFALGHYNTIAGVAGPA
jgi:hypothetical protein